jgi:hypothetical protein
MEEKEYINDQLGRRVKTIEGLKKYLKEEVCYHDIIGEVDLKLKIEDVLADHNKILEVSNIAVGKHSNRELLVYSIDIIEVAKLHIDNLQKNRQESISEKIDIINDFKEHCSEWRNYFDSMNPIRFVNNVNFLIKSDNAQLGLPIQKIQFKKDQAEYISEAFSLRKSLFEELYILADKCYNTLANQYRTPGKYRLATENPEFALMELYLSFVYSKTVEFFEGNEESLFRDLCLFFGVEVKKFADTKAKILERQRPTIFLDRISSDLEAEATDFKGRKLDKRKKSKK